MVSKYPAGIDDGISLPLVQNNVTSVDATSVNNLRDAILKIESELGIEPSGIYGTIKERMDAFDGAIGANLATLQGDLGGISSNPLVVGLYGYPIYDIEPEVDQVLQFNGANWAPIDLSFVEIGGDLSGTKSSPIVSKILQRSVSSIEPNPGQVFTWSGSEWAPQDVETNLTVLPTHIVLPNEIEFLAGDGYTSLSSSTRVGGRVIDMSLFPSQYLDGRNRTMVFKAQLEVTNALTDGYVKLKDITHNATITGTLLRTNSLSSVELSSTIYSGTTDGYMRTDSNSMYEVQIYLTGGGGSDQVICRNARIEVTYSEPLIVTALVPLALPTDIQFVCGTISKTNGSAVAIGTRYLNMSGFPATLSDGRSRHVKFFADVEVSGSGVDGYLQLYDVTNGVLVTNTNFHFTNISGQEIESLELTVGTSGGNIRNDSPAKYEVRVWKTGGTGSSTVTCSNARLMITYS